MTCPSITDLCAADAATLFAEHLAQCPRCRALVSGIEASEPPLGELEAPIAPGDGARPEPGSVWTIWAPQVEEYLVGAVLEASEEEALILPLLPWVGWASEGDIELDSEVLGYSAVAPVWASDRVLAEQAVEPVDTLSEQWLEAFTAAYDHLFAGEALDESIAGAAIRSEDDPRLAAQAAFAEELRAWYLPWRMLQGSEELGPVVAERRAELEIDPEAWSEELGIESKTWCAFEAGRADPYETVPAPTMARAVQALGMVASRRLVSLVHRSVLANNEGLDASKPAAKARRQRGSTRRTARDETAVRAAADSYAASFAQELGL
jgi:hypothetical protein